MLRPVHLTPIRIITLTITSTYTDLLDSYDISQRSAHAKALSYKQALQIKNWLNCYWQKRRPGCCTARVPDFHARAHAHTHTHTHTLTVFTRTRTGSWGIHLPFLAQKTRALFGRGSKRIPHDCKHFFILCFGKYCICHKNALQYSLMYFIYNIFINVFRPVFWPSSG